MSSKFCGLITVLLGPKVVGIDQGWAVDEIFSTLPGLRVACENFLQLSPFSTAGTIN